jgi:hypothetical protein
MLCGARCSALASVRRSRNSMQGITPYCSAFCSALHGAMQLLSEARCSALALCSALAPCSALATQCRALPYCSAVYSALYSAMQLLSEACSGALPRSAMQRIAPYRSVFCSALHCVSRRFYSVLHSAMQLLSGAHCSALAPCSTLAACFAAHCTALCSTSGARCSALAPCSTLATQCRALHRIAVRFAAHCTTQCNSSVKHAVAH